jgi:hypothetical protein
MATSETNLVKVFSVKDLEAVPSSSSFPEVKKQATKGLADVFYEDTLDLQASIAKAAEEKTFVTALWDKFIPAWFWNKVEASAPSLTIENVGPIEPIGPVPVLDEPETIADLEARKVIAGKRPFSLLAQSDNPEDHLLSLENLVMALIKSRMKLHEETGLVSADGFRKYQELAKVTREQLQLIEDKIQKDERFASYFSKAQIAIAFGTLVAAGFSLFGALPAAVPIATAVSSAIMKLGKSHLDTRANQDGAESAQRTYERDKIGDAIKDHRERLGESMQQVLEQQGKLIELNNKKRQIAEMVNRKN